MLEPERLDRSEPLPEWWPEDAPHPAEVVAAIDRWMVGLLVRHGRMDRGTMLADLGRLEAPGDGSVTPGG